MVRTKAVAKKFSRTDPLSPAPTMVRTKAVAKKNTAAGRAWLLEQQKLKWASSENDADSQWSMRGTTLDLGPKFIIGKSVFTNPKSLVAKPSARGLRPGGLADHVLWAKVGRRGVVPAWPGRAWLLTPPRNHPSQLRPPSLLSQNMAREVRRFRVQVGLAVDPNDQPGAERHTNATPNMQWCSFIMLASGRRDVSARGLGWRGCGRGAAWAVRSLLARTSTT